MGGGARGMTPVRFWRLALPFVFFNAVFYGVASIVLPLLAGGPARAGWVVASLNLGVAIGAPMWGYLVRRVRLDALGFASAGASLLGWAGLSRSGPEGVIELAFLLGLFGAGALALAPCCVTCAYAKPEWDTAIARMQSWIMGGQVLGLFAAAAVPTPWAGIGLQALALLVAAPVSLRMPRFWRQESEPVILHRPCIEPAGLAPVGWTESLRTDPEVVRLLLPLYAQWFLVALAAAPLYAVYPLFMRSVFGTEPEMAALIFALASGVAVATSATLVGLARRVSAIAILRSGSFVRLAAIVLLLYASVTGEAELLGALAFGGLVSGWAAVSVGFNAALAERVPRQNQGAALGLATGLMSLAVIVGSALGGLVSQGAGYSTMLMGASATLMLALIVSLTTRPRRAGVRSRGANARSRDGTPYAWLSSRPIRRSAED